MNALRAAYFMRRFSKEEKLLGPNEQEAIQYVINMLENLEVQTTPEYEVIRSFYGNKTASRSRFPLMRHIDEGLTILDKLEASDLAKRAFCLHPIVQNNEPIDVSWSTAYPLACEYRDRANSYLCRPETDYIVTTEQLYEVVGGMSKDCSYMLMADKRQNFADFINAHYLLHPRSDKLFNYFQLWIKYLKELAGD
jgi:hypothetical protein